MVHRNKLGAKIYVRVIEERFGGPSVTTFKVKLRADPADLYREVTLLPTSVGDP